jgi:hypothetical protein
VFRCLVSAVFGPHTPRGGCGGACPPTIAVGGSRGVLVKYCNFVVNLDHSLCRRSDDISYVNLRVFYPRRQPSITYEGIVLQLCIFLRDETVRERRGS